MGWFIWLVVVILGGWLLYPARPEETLWSVPYGAWLLGGLILLCREMRLWWFGRRPFPFSLRRRSGK